MIGARIGGSAGSGRERIGPSDAAPVPPVSMIGMAGARRRIG